MTTRIAGLALVEREEEFGRVLLALVDDEQDPAVEACTLTIDPLELFDGAGGRCRVGGIGNVATLESHRRRGLASRLLEVAIDRMRGDGMDGSLLYGIDHFYDPFGWRTCGDERWVRIPVDAWREPAGADVTIRAATAADVPALAAAYEAIAVDIPGAASRATSRAWSRFELEGALVAERDGAVVGWAWFGPGMPQRDEVTRLLPDALAFVELHAVDPGAALALVDAAAAAARSAGKAEVVTGASDAHVLRRLARAGRIECRLVDDVRPHGGAMLLPFTPAGERLLAIGDLYQFIPDRF